MASADKASDGQFGKLIADIAARLLGHIQICEIQGLERELLESAVEHLVYYLGDMWPESREAIDVAARWAEKQVGKGKGKKARRCKNRRARTQSPDLHNDASCDP